MKNLLRLTALVLSITACPPCGNSQNRPLPIYVPSQNYTVNDGLPSNHVYGIVQDSTGFIWIGTDNGLSRFDGHSFRNYLHAGSNPASLSSNNIRRLAIDRRQRLWLSLDNGVEIYDPGTETFEHFDLKTPDSVAVEGQTIEIIEDSDGEIWISTVNSGVFRYSPESQHLTVYRHNPQDENSLSQDYVSTLYQSNDGTIWMGTYSEGLCAFSKTDSRFTRYTKEQGLSSNSIDAITEDSYGNLWLGTVTSGLDCFDRTTGRFTNYDASRFDGRLMRIHALSETSPGELLVCTENGASRFRISEQGLHPADASEAGFTRTGYFSIYSALQDREGNLWFGSLNNGVMFYPAHNDFSCYMLRGEEPANSGHVVNTICPVGDGSYLLGTPDNRILRFDERSGSLSLYRESRHPGSTGHDIYAMLIDEGTLWIAAFQYGIEAVDLRSGRSRFYLNNPAEPSSRVFRLFRSSNGRIWAGTSVGLYYYDRTAARFLATGPTSLVKSITEDLDARLWIGTSDDGIYTCDLRSNQFQHFEYRRNDSTTISRNSISALAVDRNNRVWVGTAGYGLCHYDRTLGHFIRHEELQLPGSNIVHLIPDDEYLWIATDRGLAVYRPDTGMLRSYTSADGLCSDLFVPGMGLRTPEGRILLGTTSGLCLFNPYDIIENRPVPPVTITDLAIDNQSVLPDASQPEAILHRSVGQTRHITLKHRQNALAFSFASLNYASSGNLCYRYRLDGLDNQWRSTSRRNATASYNNLSPGKYRFRVQAGYGSDNWTSPETTLTLEILPPLLLSKPALILYALLLLAGLFAGVRFQLRRTERKHREKIAEIQRQNEHRMYDQRINFFTNIAHEIRTPLSLIIGPLEYVMKSRRINDEYGEYLTVIERNYHRLRALVDQLLDFRRIDSDNYRPRYDTCDTGTLIRELLGLFRPTLAQRNIRLDEELPPSGPMLVTDREALTKIISNLLSNAIKFARHRIRLRVWGSERGFSLEIEDDGPGIPDAELERIFEAFYQASNNTVRAGKGGVGIGLHMCRTYAEMMHGTIEASARPDGASGARFTLFLPNHPATGEEPARPAAGESPEKSARRSPKAPKAPQKPEAVQSPEAPEAPTPQPETGQQTPPEPDAGPSADSPSERRTAGEEIPAQPDRTSDTDAGSTAAPKSERRRILLVDDNPEILDFLDRILRNDYTTLSAESGEEALKLLRDREVDMVVSDIMMEGIDGIELCRTIKSQLATSHIPVILLTAKTDLASKIEGLECGADAYIEKPFSPEHLRAQIANLLVKLEEIRRHYSELPMSEFRTISHNRLDEEFIDRCREIIITHMSEPDLSVELLARELAMSRTSIFKKLKAVTGMTPNDFMKLVRLKEASRLLAEGRYRISEIGFIAGFSSSSYFAKCFARQFGVLPTEFLRNLDRRKTDPAEDS